MIIKKIWVLISFIKTSNSFLCFQEKFQNNMIKIKTALSLRYGLWNVSMHFSALMKVIRSLMTLWLHPFYKNFKIQIKLSCLCIIMMCKFRLQKQLEICFVIQSKLIHKLVKLSWLYLETFYKCSLINLYFEITMYYINFYQHMKKEFLNLLKFKSSYLNN